MSVGLPPVAPPVFADAVDALPGRLRKRLDETVVLARSWPVVANPAGGVTVTVDPQTTVTMADPVRSDADAVCTCLLTPRCLHRTAVLALAPVLADPDPDPRQPDHDRVEVVAGTALTPAQLAAADALWRAAAPVLETGIAGAGSVVQADLLRAVHAARSASLPRAAAAGVRVVQLLRAARADEAWFSLADLTDDLCELLTVCHQINGSHGDLVAARGTARRDYDDIGSIRLWGLFCEPVLTASGYAGAAAYLCDDTGRLWTISEIRPGGVADARALPDAGVTVGEARLSHREAGRAGLMISGARASANGRLSGAGRVRAVRSTGRPWTQAPLADLFRVPLADQVARYHDALGQPAPARVAGHDLVFLAGTLLTGPGGLALDVTGVGPVAVTAPVADPGLPTVANLRQLARAAAGRPALLIARLAAPRTVLGLALAAPWLPAHFGGHVDLGVDVLQRPDLPGSAGTATPPEAGSEVTAPDALQLLRFRLQRAVSGGRAAVRTPSAADAARLVASQLPAGAAVLASLQVAAQRRTRDVFGRIDRADTDQLARAWLAAATYCHAADRHLATAGWLSPDAGKHGHPISVT